jgi:hopene-associated glycosyltransferase HpnB
MGLFKIASFAALAAWTSLVFARGRFWEAPADELPEPPRPFKEAPRIHAVVPARNEASVLARTLPTLLNQRELAAFDITLVDDHSEDATADVARSIAAAHPSGARLSIVAAGPRPQGWTGKVWALHEGVRAALARRGAPDYWLFTDADVAHDPESAVALAAKAVGDRRDLVSLMVRLHCSSPWERLLIPAFVFFFRKLFPFRWVNDDREPTAAAAGGCILISHEMLMQIGGLDRIASAVIDDCALASAVKRGGGRLWLGLSTRLESVRPYASLEELWAMVARSAYAQLGYSRINLAATVAGMSLLYFVPPIATLCGALRRDRILSATGAAAWAMMSSSYLPTLKLYRRPPLAALALPVASLLYTLMTIDSALRYESGIGNTWKGRALNGRSSGPSSSATPPTSAAHRR